MPETPGAVAHGAVAGAKEAFEELLDVLFEIVVPVVTLVIGYVMSPTIGLSGALGTIIDGALGSTNVSATTMARIASGTAALIWGGVAGGMWTISGKKEGRSKYVSWVLRPLSTFFAGLALGEVGALAGGKVLNGSIGALATGVHA